MLITNNGTNGILDSFFIDPINTGANIFGTGISIEALEISKKQLRLAKESHQLDIENNANSKKSNLELQSVLNQILEQLVILNEKIDNINEVSK